MFSGGGAGMGLDAGKMQEMMQMLQQPNALKEMLSNPELMQESMKQAAAARLPSYHPLGSAPARVRPLGLLRARLAALGSSVLPR